jgi:hypothetical protein
MERSGHRQQHRATHALGLGDFDRALDGGLVSGHDNLSAAVVVGRLDQLAVRGLRRNCRRLVEVDAKQCSHGAHPDGDGALHRLTADAHQTHGVGKR